MLAVIVVQIQNAQLAISASRTSKATVPQDIRCFRICTEMTEFGGHTFAGACRYKTPQILCVFLHGVLIPGPSCSKPDINPGLTLIRL